MKRNDQPNRKGIVSDRRTALATVGMLAVGSGCFAEISSEKYEGVSEDALDPGTDILSKAWSRSTMLSDEKTTAYVTDDKTTHLRVQTMVLPEVGDAKKTYKTDKTYYDDPNPYNLADQAFWTHVTEPERYVVEFRHSNAVAKLWAWSVDEAFSTKSFLISIARDMFEYWKQNLAS